MHSSWMMGCLAQMWISGLQAYECQRFGNEIPWFCLFYSHNGISNISTLTLWDDIAHSSRAHILRGSAALRQMYPERAACQAWQILVSFTLKTTLQPQTSELNNTNTNSKELMHRHGHSLHISNKTYSDRTAVHWGEVHLYLKDAWHVLQSDLMRICMYFFFFL